MRTQRFLTRFPRSVGKRATTANSLAKQVAKALRVPTIEEYALDAKTGQFTFSVEHSLRFKTLADWPDPARLAKLGLVFMEQANGSTKHVLVGTRHGVIRLRFTPDAQQIVDQLGRSRGGVAAKVKKMSKPKRAELVPSEQSATEDEVITRFRLMLPKPDIVMPAATGKSKVAMRREDLVRFGLIDSDEHPTISAE